ncbi:esterase-like activity of phytase family protein, partial [Chamaesiphon polymorphus]|uniref:esterase-like activity of phytase family protein n=1 Tax=Chamaesiphon polymorphus TaxID=2107691 RepID=UPI0011B257D1
MGIVNGTNNDDVLFIDAGKSNDTLLGLAGNDYLDALAGNGNNTLRGGDGNDELYAYTNDRLEGEAGNDSLTSDGNGSNTLSGGDGDDTIYADRNDTVAGDAGDDKIYGGQGGNTISGGAGKDVFWVANVDVPTTPNTITDFDRLNDTIRVNLAGVSQFSDLTIAKSGSDATVSFGVQQLALLKNTEPGSLNSNTVAVNPTAPNNAGSNVTSYDFTNLPKLGTTSKGQDLFLGGFSGLYFQGIAANGNLKFITHTDRGPNGEPTGANRPFLLPTFQPEIVSFELNRNSGEINITKRTGLFRADGKTPLTGLPNLQARGNGLAYTDEIGVDLDGKVLPNDPLGADVEGIVIGSDGNYWMVDEYRPAIYRFDTNGKLLDRFIPKGTSAAKIDLVAIDFGTEVLPEVYAQRRSNRGFEAVAIEGTKLYAFMQSPIDNPDNAGDTVSRASRTVRILEFDTATKAVTGEYLYLLDDITGTGNAKTDKLGDAVSLGGGKFAVVERDDLATTASNKLIYQIDLATATNINNPANFTLPAGKTIEQLTPAELTTAKIAPVSKSLIANAAQLGYTGVEKLEGLALVAPNTLALINDNDFNVAPGSKVPEKLGLLELSKNLPVTGIISTKIITATDPADLLLGAKESNTRIIGDSRNNVIDVSISGGNNQIYAGEGADELYAGTNDRLFGEGGNDILDATDGKGGNELDGGTGNDRLFAATNDRLLGGEGDDTFFAGLGNNTLTGGNGKDTFILAVTTLPTSINTITDFKIGTDALKISGIPGIGDDLTKLTTVIQGNDTLLRAGTVDLALL